MTLFAGIDCGKIHQVRGEIMNQLAACCSGDISEAELAAAKQSICSGMRAAHDSAGSIESYYSTAALSGLALTPAAYMEAAQNVTLADVVAAANTLKLHTVYFLEGVSQ
jgi:predicted Zn-dependent peptidase